MSPNLTKHFYFSNTQRGFSVLLCLFILLLHYQVFASIKTIKDEVELLKVTGQVLSSDDQTGLPGVAIIIKGTSEGTITDAEGNYTLEAPGDATLIFSYTGYLTQEIPVNSRSTINIEMSPDITEMEELIVVGYGMQKKSHLTGAVSKVSNERLDQIPISRVDDALVGQVSGVNIQMTNPAAGEAPTIQIRGQGSISFESTPLVVVDGIVVGNDADFLSSIDMNNVSSVEILKDAASAAIYGSRGANGIIMITTKDGVEGPMKLSYNTYVGIKSVPSRDVLPTIGAWNDYVRANNNGELTDRLEYIQRLGTETNWEEVMMDGGMIQSHSISASGGTKKTKFRAALSYLRDEGVLLTDNFEKINLRLNLDTKISERISFGITLNPSHTIQQRFPIGIHDAVRQHAWLPLYLDENNIQFVNRFRENGRWADAQVGDYAMERMFDDYDLEAGEPSTGSGTDISATSNQSALAKVLERDYKRFQTKVLSRAYFKVKIVDGLSFRQNIGADIRYSRRTQFTGVEASRNGAGDAGSFRDTDLQFHVITESLLNFDKKIGNHDVNAVAGFAYEGWSFEESRLEAAGFENDFIQTISTANEVTDFFTNEEREALISYLSRVNYSYADKYLLSVSARWDGSSRFGPDNKFGFFPAVSVGWRVSQENFLAGSNLIYDLKLRVSYGVTGSNSGIGRYDHISLISPVATAINGIGSGFNPINVGNPNLKWEKLIEFNPGIDVSFLKGRLALSVDYYDRRSQDLLIDLPIPSVTGFSDVVFNRGQVKNEGVELEIRTRNFTGKDFSWNTSVLMTHNKNTLLDFGDSDGTIQFVDDKRPAEFIALVGNPISSFYGYVMDGEIPLEFINNPFYPIGAQSQDVYARDINGDGVIDPDDRTILGSPYPDFIWSVNNVIKYKNFDFSFMFQGSHGAEIRNISSQYINNEFSSSQDYTSDFPDADLVVQRIFTNDDIQDASYIALRNVNLGYTLPNNIIPGVRNLRVYIAAQNLIYLMASDYVGYNPEGIDQGRNNPLTYGYQRGPAPIFRTFSAGFNIDF